MRNHKTLLAIFAIVALSTNVFSGIASRQIARPAESAKQVVESGGQEPDALTKSSIGSVLDADGRVRSGAEGSFDSAGYKMVLGANDEPIFVRDDVPDSPQSVAGDLAWDSRFSVNGISGSAVFTIVKDAAGNLYIGGSFNAIGTVLARNIAKFDGSRWSAMGTGLDGIVTDIVPYGTDIYVVGSFDNAGGVASSSIAKWSNSTSSWSALPGGGLTRTASSNDFASAITIRNDDIYVGGNFTHAGVTLVNRIARFNITTSTWHALGTGVTHATEANPGVRDLGFDSNGILYVTGLFTSAGGVTANVIAQWNGSAWSAVGSTTWGGFPPFAESLTVSGTDVYVGGRFSQAGGVSANNVAKWNGSAWSALGTGTNALVTGIHVSAGTVYVVGDFSSAGGDSNLKNAAKFNIATSTWSSFGTNLNSTTYAIFMDNTDTYLGGYFTRVGSGVAVGIAKWNGTDFDPLFGGSFGASQFISDIAISGSNMYVSGAFQSIGDITARYIARWDGSTWHPLKDPTLAENGTSGVASDLAVSGDTLWVVDVSFQGDPESPRKLAKWNNSTSTWSSIPGSGNVTGLGGVGVVEVSGNDVYVGGSFASIAGVSGTSLIARWNTSTSQWFALGTGLTGPMTYPGVYKIKASGSNIYVGGQFDSAGGVTVNNIARWDGTAFAPLGLGITGDASTAVYAIDVAGNGDVYAGGAFTTAGSTPASNIAKWEVATSSWSALGAGLNSTVNSIEVTPSGDVYAGGSFTTAGGNAANYIARFSGGNWSPLGSGLNNGIGELHLDGSSLWVGGSFTIAGSVVAGRITRYLISNFNGASGGNWHTPGSWQSNAVPTLTTDAVISDADVSVTDSDAVVRDLQIGAGRTLTIADGRTLTVHGKLIVQGEIVGAGDIEVLTCDPEAILLYNGAYLKSAVSRCVNPASSYTFPVGTNNSYSPVRLSNISTQKMVTVKANEGSYPNPPARLPSNRAPRWWKIEPYDLAAIWDSGSAPATFSADLTFYYKPGEITLGDPAVYKAWRISGTTAQNVGGSSNPATSSLIVTGISEFSDWTLAVGRATAAPSAIEGRVFDANGRPVANASVLITKSDGETVTVKTNSFGRYRFTGIVAGETYLVMAQTRWNLYMPQVVTLSGDLADLDFRP